jgi:hypothetical protein
MPFVGNLKNLQFLSVFYCSVFSLLDFCIYQLLSKTKTILDWRNTDFIVEELWIIKTFESTTFKCKKEKYIFIAVTCFILLF